MRKIISAAIVGNTLEIYDLIIYGLFAPVIAGLFFPNEDKFAGIISTFAVFLIGYLARPIGALFFGRMGDRLGRKLALMVSIWLIAVSSFALAMLPTYATIGVWAPVLLTVLRLLQGFSVGAELIGSTIFIIEHAPKSQRGFFGSLGVAGFSLGLLLASFVSWLIHISFSNIAIASWAWRLPFLLGALGGLLGWFIRRNVPETELFYETYRLPTTYFETRRDLAKQLRPMAFIMGIELFGSVLSYLMYIFLVTYMTMELQYTMRQALSVNLTSVMLLVLLQPLMGKLSDVVGRRPLLVFGLIGVMLWVWPDFLLLQQHNLVLALLGQVVMTLFGSAYFGIDVVTMVELVPVQMRFSIVAFAYAVAVSLFGGATPFIASLLIKMTHSHLSLVLYLAVAALLSLFTVYKVRETRPKPTT